MALSCCKNVEIVRRKCLTKNEFDEIYFKQGIPVLIENAAQDWPSRHWTLDSLCESAGHNPVYVRSNTSCKNYQSGVAYNIRQTTLQQYIDDLKADNKRARNSYLAVQNIKKAFPQLQHDVPIPEYIGKMHGGPFLWIARKGHYEYCHVDADDGFLAVLSGRKQARLFGCQVAPLYPNPLGTKGRTLQSSVCCEAPDPTAHPLFSTATCHHCTLSPGDMLYIPAFWWHQITSTELTISVNFFWGNAGTNDYLTKVMEPPLWPIFSHWLLNVVEQNRRCASFGRMLSRLSEALYHFVKNQWHEEASDAQAAALSRLVLDYLGLTEAPTQQSCGKNPPPLRIRGLLWRS